MKKLMALIALVAMVAVSSVTYAQTDTVDVSVTLGSVLEVDMTAGTAPCDSNAPAITYTADLADLGTRKDDSCNFQTTATVLWDLATNDADDATECNSATCNGGIAGVTYATTGAIIPAGTGTLLGGTAGVGFYGDSTDGHADTCDVQTATCAAIAAGSSWVVDATPDVEEDWTFNFNVAVDDDPAQYADSYNDTWTVTISAA